MSSRAISTISYCGKGLETAVQVGFLVGLWWICQSVANIYAKVIPGGILGMLLLVFLLLSGLIPKQWISRGAGFLLEHLLLFFVPAAMTLLNHPEFFGWIGIKVLVVVISGVCLVMVGTATAVDWHIRMRSRHAC